MQIRIVKDGTRPEPVAGHWALEETVWDAVLDMKTSHPGSSIAVYTDSEDSSFIELLFVGPSNTYAEPPPKYPSKHNLHLQGILNTHTREVK